VVDVAGAVDPEGGPRGAGAVECCGWWKSKKETASMVSSATAPTAAAGVLSSANGR
jgi:hypothetical protein